MTDLSNFLPKDLLLDLYDMTVVQALEAHNIIRERTNLKGKGARGAEGQLRFRILEQGFKDICEQYGGVLIEDGLTISDTTYRIHQPFMRFSNASKGVILAFASMPAKKEMPNKNKSREAGVKLNYYVSPRLALDGHDTQPGDIFVLFLAARDSSRAGHIEEVAIGVIESNYESYAFYETIEKFMERYAKPAEVENESKKNLVKLKKAQKTYIPPEAPEEKSDEEKEE